MSIISLQPVSLLARLNVFTRFISKRQVAVSAPSPANPFDEPRLGWWQRRRTRRQLAKLDDIQLADIGLTREQARLEVNRPFWK